MKTLPVLVACLGWLGACRTPPPTLLRVPQAEALPAVVRGALADSERACSRAYGQAAVWLIENRCPGAPSRRITLIDALGVRRFASYDAAFTDWAWAEGCNAPAACDYELGLEAGAVRRFVYRFEINLTAGEIEVEVGHGRLRVVGKHIVHDPS